MSDAVADVAGNTSITVMIMMFVHCSKMGECVKVIVRCRPMNTREKDLKCNCVIKMEENVKCSITNPNDEKAPPKSFTFDGSYFTDSTTENIYNEIAYPLVEVCDCLSNDLYLKCTLR